MKDCSVCGLTTRCLAVVAGHEKFEHLLQSPHAAPLHGESMSRMFYRTKDYYDSVLRPRQLQGKTILVVSHQYILVSSLCLLLLRELFSLALARLQEMFGLMLTGMSAEQYFDFSLPNAKPFSEDGQQQQPLWQYFTRFDCRQS